MLLGLIPFVGGLGLPELMIFAVVVLLVFGKRIPGTMRSLGRSIVEFKKGTSDAEASNDDGSKDS
ncbi:MAG: Sec-independent protein translocase subunit TatA/TatB [Planctomycetales bacterium]|jgi:sec-independent protein translocase protein TatA